MNYRILNLMSSFLEADPIDDRYRIERLLTNISTQHFPDLVGDLRKAIEDTKDSTYIADEKSVAQDHRVERVIRAWELSTLGSTAIRNIK